MIQKILTHSTTIHPQYNGNMNGKLFPILALVRQLCDELDEAGIIYCHWKSNNAIGQSAIGENDLDLLVSRPDIPRFTEVLFRLSFKQVEPPAIKKMPGVLDYLGYDRESDKFVHVHAHYQLIIGHDMTKNYRLTVERAYLESSVQGPHFKIPSPEFEFIVFVIRMVLKHSTWDAILSREGGLTPPEKDELSFLMHHIDYGRVQYILKSHFPQLDNELFERCIDAIRPSSTLWKRIKTGYQLQAALKVNARRSPVTDTFLKQFRRAGVAIRRRTVKPSLKYRLGSGGAMIAIVGGDGAGKTTAVEGIYSWLSGYFQLEKVHLGKPPWSLTTIAVRGILKLGSLLGLFPAAASLRNTLKQKSLISPGYPWLFREMNRARDRFRAYKSARRYAADGRLVVFDRFPVSQIRLMDGPLTAEFIEQLESAPQTNSRIRPRRNQRLVRNIVEREKWYYRQFAPPEVLIVLRVDPKIAVERKTSEEASFVQERSQEIWDLDWEHENAILIDAGKSQNEVISEIKGLIWSAL